MKTCLPICLQPQAMGRLLQISILLQCGDGYKFKLNSTNFTVN